MVAMAALALSAGASYAQLTLNFASTPGSTIQFNGASSSFQFNASALGSDLGTEWQIGSQNGGTGTAAIGLFGGVSNGPFTYGPITTLLMPGLTYESADVLGPLGNLYINDGLGYLLTGNVSWVQVATYNYAGAINAALTINLSGLTYSGLNPDLSTLVADSPGSMNLTFQFSPGRTLADLTTGSGPYDTSYSGSLSVPPPVPEPSSVTYMLLGMGALVASWRMKQSKQA